MNALLPVASVAIALAAAAGLLWSERGRRPGLWAFAPLAVLAPLGAVVVAGHAAPTSAGPLAAGLAVAALTRAREDLLHSECALKLLWVVATAFALSWAGSELLVVTSGSTVPLERWAALAVGLDSPMVWGAAIPLSLLVGLVLLAGAPFHFWAADLVQGARPWLAPLIAAALQVSGVVWIERRLESIEVFAEAEAVANGLLGIAAGTALAVGGLTLLWQRRPERLVGTLVSLHGGLALAAITAARGPTGRVPDGMLEAWAAHLVLALTGAAMLARLLPVPDGGPAEPAPLFRRHPWAGIAGLYAVASLAGVPGTPGAALWLDVARALAVGGHTTELLALGFAWVASFALAARMTRDAFGIAAADPPDGNPVPVPVRATLWLSAAGLAASGVARWVGVG